MGQPFATGTNPPNRRMNQVIFIADCMLRRLARWLRILGYDTVYDNFAADDDLLRVAEAQNRTLLTRDRPLAERAQLNDSTTCVYIHNERLEDQIAQLAVDVDLELNRPTFTRCLECNDAIVEVGGEDVTSIVPPYVRDTHSQFFQCPVCHRVYWSGSHAERMEARLNEIRLIVKQRTGKITSV